MSPTEGHGYRYTHVLNMRMQDWLSRIWYQNASGKWLLLPLSWLFRRLVGLRRLLYRFGLCSTIELKVPVVVVGNITVGGTGKTPLVIWLVQQLAALGWRPGVVSRGYGAAKSEPRLVTPSSIAAEVGDEPLLIARSCSCPVVVGVDRVAAGRLVEKQGVDLIVSDDGLQHYRLARAVEIAVVDGERGLGNGHCLPAGPLREPPGRLDTVDLVVINGDDYVRAGALRMSLRGGSVRSLHGDRERPLSEFAGKPVHAVAAIGNPDRFFSDLRAAGLRVSAHPHRDHAMLEPAAVCFDDDLPVLMTEKDAVKYRDCADHRHWYVPVEAWFSESDAEYLLSTVRRKIDSVTTRNM